MRREIRFQLQMVYNVFFPNLPLCFYYLLQFMQICIKKEWYPHLAKNNMYLKQKIWNDPVFLFVA